MRYHNITSDDMLNGDGLRVVLWLAGCNHCCKGCQNPVTWDPDGGLLFDSAARQEIFDELDKSYISGITFSGGDPLHPANRMDVRELMAQIKDKYPEKTIWLYTGDRWEDILHYSMMQYIDVLVDGEFREEEKDVKLLWKGSANQRVIDVKRTLARENPSVPVLHCGNYAQEYTMTEKPGYVCGCCDWGGLTGAASMEFEGVRLFPILELGISQIYLDKSKIEAIEKWFRPGCMDNFEPLRVHDFGIGRYTIIDGHSRAYVACQAGLTHVPAIYEKDDIVAGKEGKCLYRADIEWCNRFKLRNISHLHNRIVSREKYEKLWIERCDRSYCLLILASNENRDSICREPELYLYGMSEDLATLYYENEAGDLFLYRDGTLAREET